MINFKKYLKESSKSIDESSKSINESIFSHKNDENGETIHNSSPGDLKKLVDLSRTKTARFLIHPNGSISASNYHIHGEIADDYYHKRMLVEDPYKNNTIFG